MTTIKKTTDEKAFTTAETESSDIVTGYEARNMSGYSESAVNKFQENQQDFLKQPLSQLAMRFTAWLEIVVKRAKIDYIRMQKKRYAEVLIGDINKCKALVLDQQSTLLGSITDFEFENDQVSVAFSKLTSKRRQILTLLFVQNLAPYEVAEELHCSERHVYNQHSLALKQLKDILSKENE